MESERDEDEYAFIVNSATSPEKMDVTIGGAVVEMLIDSGTSTNVIDKNLWSKLKQDKIKCVSRKSDKKLYSYGSKQPLNVLGTFSALVRIEGKETEAEFVVINGEGVALLGRETAIQLGVLKLGTRICTVISSETIMSDYKGVGKLKDYQVKLHVNPDVPPVVQPVRRTPFSLRDKVKEKIEELVGIWT